ncbi:MAG: molybdopterin-dependent oxidoreductase, partial [Rhodospirillales bacterium]|nr:molybdopterin-dependent oxidoreductase [Rhodospirillales bacterium]
MGRFGAGQPARRSEDFRFLTGTGRYTDDIRLAGQTCGYVVRSPHAHARILAIESEAARAAPGIIALFTAADLAAEGVNTLPVVARVRNRDGSRMVVPPRQVLASERVRHVGEAVAFIVAETIGQAKDAADLLIIDYDPLPAVADPVAALRPDAPCLWDFIPGNQCFDWETGDSAATEAAFARAAHVAGLDLVNNRLAPTPLEARGALGHVDETGRLVLTTGSQGSHQLQEWLCDQVFRIPRQSLRVICPDVGGGFGLRLFLFPEHVLVLFAARRLGRPVKWIADRSEAFLADSHGRGHVSHAELALDRDGRFLAIRVETVADLGACLSQYAAFIPTGGGSAMLVGAYTFEAAHVRVRGAMTNTAPVDAYRGAGRPEAAYLLERLIDVAAREMGLAPDGIRRRNFIPPQAMPYRTALGLAYDSGEFLR